MSALALPEHGAQERPHLTLATGTATPDEGTAEVADAHLWETVDATGLSPDQLDEVARAIARAAEEGTLDERECAHRIASLVATSPILDQVARRYCRRRQRVVDLAESLRWSLVNLILDAERGFFDLQRMRTASFAGWLRQTGTVFASRDTIVRPRSLVERNTVLWATTPADEADSQNPGSWFFLDTESSAEDQATATDLACLVDSAERLLAKTRSMRTSTRLFATAVEVRRVMGLPRLCVPSTDADRQWVLDMCEQDPAAAGRSLRTMIGLLCGDVDPGTVDERMLALWDDFPLEALQTLEVAPDELIHVLVVGHVMPAPKPSRAALRALRKAVKALSPVRGWHDLATRLVASFVARTTSPVSDFDSTSDEMARLAMVSEARKLAEQWPDLVARAVAWPSAPLGADVGEVAARLEAMLFELIEGD